MTDSKLVQCSHLDNNVKALFFFFFFLLCFMGKHPEVIRQHILKGYTFDRQDQKRK